jgi:cell division septation protein DedD
MAKNARDAAWTLPQRRFGLRDLARIGTWGMLAAGAVVVVVYAATTDAGEDRIMLALAQLRGTAQPPPRVQVARGFEQAEAHRLSETVRLLAADRERLIARISTLERNFDDLTGSISRAAPTALPPATSEPAAVPTTPLSQASPPVSATPQATASPQAPAATSDNTATRTEFGIDLGAAANVEGLRALWTAAKAKHGGLLEGLRPLMVVRESARPGGVELRLVAGPIANAASAARLCATLVAVGATCQPATFDGQRLAMR